MLHLNLKYVLKQPLSVACIKKKNIILKNLLIIGFIFLFYCCSNNNIQAKQIKSLDSISGALNLKLTELQKADTVILVKALTKFSNYNQFIKQNINDTVSKKEADALQHFILSGTNLENFFSNRASILARGKLVNSQLNKLISDIKENVIDQNQSSEFTIIEKEQANDVIQKSYIQQQAFQTYLQEFKNALPLVEELIKNRNNGQLPTIIKDSTSL